MPASVIGVTGLNQGFVGNIDHSDFPLRTPRTINPSDTLFPAFGDLMVLNANNTYSAVTQFIANGNTLTGSTPVCLAVANVKTNAAFPLAGNNGVLTPAGVYVPGQVADGLTLGSMSVYCRVGTPAGAGGSVFVRAALNSAQPAGVVGGLEAVADAAVSTTGTATSGSTALTVASGTGIAVGQIVTGTGIAPNTSVVAVNGTAVTLNQPTTAALSNGAVSFNSSVLMPNLKWKNGISLTSNGVYSVTILTRQIP